MKRTRRKKTRLSRTTTDDQPAKQVQPGRYPFASVILSCVFVCAYKKIESFNSCVSSARSNRNLLPVRGLFIVCWLHVTRSSLS